MVTILTLVWLIFGMHSFMYLKTTGCATTIHTMLAFIRLLARMSSLVNLQRPKSRASVVTVRAVVKFFSRVGFVMIFQMSVR
jgi:hypothetical protein